MDQQLKIQPAYGKWWFLCEGVQAVEDLAPVETVTIGATRLDSPPISCLAKDMPDWGHGRLWRMQDTTKQKITQ